MVRCVIITVSRAMPLIGAASGDHLYLRAAGSIKVSRLTERIDFELFDSFDRRRHHARDHPVSLSASSAGKVVYVCGGGTGHVVGVVATIDGEGVLVLVAAGNIAGRRHARL